MRNMTENQQKHAVPGSDYLLSLTSIVGKPIKDLVGYVSKEFDTSVFHVSRVLFEDGTQVSMEGEHDTAYICADDKVPGLSDENLETLRVSRVLFEDGTQVSMEGEHDTAYICADDKVPGLSDENLETLHDSYGEDPDEDDEDDEDDES